ncbi:hypothetical protein E4U43_005672 [Claviceps pusilla]|uniref:Uncharacterized protein n=1 Tax=Claviceps pusilla TaxID=123648 RepID=A0A9P7SW06_9HYPO|nr:hypothetical protein E4U43_005672 [Claviceps pusilla]
MKGKERVNTAGVKKIRTWLRTPQCLVKLVFKQQAIKTIFRAGCFETKKSSLADFYVNLPTAEAAAKDVRITRTWFHSPASTSTFEYLAYAYKDSLHYLGRSVDQARLLQLEPSCMSHEILFQLNILQQRTRNVHVSDLFALSLATKSQYEATECLAPVSYRIATTTTTY